MKQTRNTKAKLEVLGLLKKSDKALSVAEIYNALNEICDRVTVYRILKRLVNENIIHEIIHEQGAKYIFTSEEINFCHHHLHLYCERCKSLVCLDNHIPSLDSLSDFKISKINFTAYGLCKNCV